MQKISVIIPVFNAANTIERCLNSVINQSYDNLEIIVVNDGSRDETLSILNKYKKQDERIKIISQDNRGASTARNKGIEHSRGEVITFVDADDYIEPLVYEYSIRAMNEYNADIVSTAIREIYNGDKTECRNNSNDICIIDGVSATKLMLSYSGGIRTVVWDKIYKREIIGNIRCNEEYKYCEDALFNFRVFLNCYRYVRIPYIGYNYDHRMSKLTGANSYNSSRLSNIYAVDEMYNYLSKDNMDSLKKELNQFQIAIYRQVFHSLLLTGNYKDEHKTDYRTICIGARKIDNKTIRENLNFRDYLQWKMYLYWPSLFLVAHKLNHIF